MARGSNREGFTIIVVVMLVVIATTIAAALIPQALRGVYMAKNYADSARAFYAAESGINAARVDMDDDGSINSLTVGTWYSVVNGAGDTVSYYKIDSIDITDPQFPVVVSVGSSPSSTAADPKRYITATLSQQITPNPGLVTNAIEATGDINVGGSATVNGDVEGDGDPSFAAIFGTTKANMKNNLTTAIVDPANNYAPVTGITWFEVVDNERVQMTAGGWSGSGIMVVEGDLKLTGGTFNGIVWVTGNCDLDVAGNATVNGAIFVEGEANITGSCTLSFDSGEVGTAMDSAFSQDPITYWKEIYPSES